MLINVFGTWLMADKIITIDEARSGCHVKLIAGSKILPLHYEGDADEVAEEINKQIRKSHAAS